jgi:hypothetical protein
MYYMFENHITYLFAKHACPITFKNKTSIWELVNDTPIESKHPPLRNLKIS